MSSFRIHFLAAATVVLVATCPGSAQKAQRPNFSGTWEMQDTHRSLDPSERNLIIERQTVDPSAISLTISDDGSDIKVLRKFTLHDEVKEQNVEYHADGRGETNPTVTSGKITFHTRTRGKRDRLVIGFDSLTVSTSGRPLIVHREIEWRLEEGGARFVETDTTHFQESSTIDSTVSASNLRGFSLVPPSITVRRIYKRIS